MRRVRRGRKRTGSTHLSISATDAEWRDLLVQARAAGLSRPRFAMLLVEQDTAADGGGFSALSPAEQREMLETVRKLRSLARAQAPPVAPSASAPERRPAADAAVPPASDDGGADEPAADDGESAQGRLLL